MAAAPVVGSFQADIQSVALLTPYGYYFPDKLKKLFKKVPRTSALSWMYAMGNMSKRTAHNFTYEFYEEGQWMKAAATISSFADGSGTNDVDITLSSADHMNSGNNSFPIVTNTVVFKDGTVGFVSAVNRTTPNAHVVTVESTDGTTDLFTVAANSDPIVFFANAQTEDSTAPESRVPQVTREENYIQTFRETFRVTDHEASTQTWFEIDGQPFLYVKGIEDAAERFEMQQELAFLVGQSFDSAFQYNSLGVKATDGLIPTIRSKGETVLYDKTSMTPDLDDWEEIILAIDKNYGPRDYMAGLGLDLDLKMNRFLVNFVNSTAGGGMIDWSPFKGGKEQALSLNIQAVNYSGRQFFLQRWDVLSHTDTLGATGLTYRNLGIFCPLGKVKNPNAQYASKNFEDYVQIVYIPPQGSPTEVRDHYKIWETGGNALPKATNDQLRREIHHACYKGFEMRNKEKFLLFEPEP